MNNLLTLSVSNWNVMIKEFLDCYFVKESFWIFHELVGENMEKNYTEKLIIDIYKVKHCG